jgi:uncharacterized protein YcbK (DUF882 family)
MLDFRLFPWARHERAEIAPVPLASEAFRMTNNMISRRAFLTLGPAGLLAAPEILRAGGASILHGVESRSLSFHNLHTEERLTAVYWERGQYLPGALAQVNHILRDHRNGDVREMAPQLLDALAELALRLETSKPFEIISGYRSPATNAMLRRQGHAVAESSLHMKGIAVDVRIPGRDLLLVRKELQGALDNNCVRALLSRLRTV